MKDKKLYKHHIIPRHAGGSDDSSNIKLVTLEEHAEEHRILYEKYGRWQDRAAWKMLSSEIGREDIMKEIRLENGKKQGKINAENGHMKKIQSQQDHTAIGKKSAEICKEKKVNSFFNEELRRNACKKGGEVQGKINAKSGHLKRIGLLPRKYHRKYWYTNGIDSLLIKEGKQIPKGYQKGRICPRKKN